MQRTRLIAVLVVVAATIAAGFWWLRRAEVEVPPVETEQHVAVRHAALHNVSSELVNEVLRIEAEERRVAETVWAREMLAQECGRTIERLWDEINAATNKLAVLARFGLGEVQLGRWDQAVEHGHNIRFLTSTAAGDLLLSAEWQDTIARFQSSGWKLDQIEFRHNRFEVDAQGRPARSLFYFAANLSNASETNRVSFEGDLELRWGEKSAEDGRFDIRKLDARGLTLKTRRGEPPFKLVLDEEIIPQGQSKQIDPLIVYDLNGDGLSEIILAGRNLVFRNRGNFDFPQEALCKYPEEFIGTALIADFDNDGLADFLCAKWEGLFLFKGSASGTFDQKARLVWKPERPLEKPMVITCGDIDADGDLDLFLGQYKDPYEGGVTPRPFYDANDGYPAYLLVNDGKVGFADRTAEAGLRSKRMRRTFSASFVDLDRDDKLDLLVVSDFAGADIYRNNGDGRFEEKTRAWLEEPRAFGMAHSLADFNNDGLLDILMIGMTSPTLERLNHSGLMRTTNIIDRSMELAMTYGNRFLYGKQNGGFEQPAVSDAIARAGWAWGCANLDFDHDGWDDVHISNGFQTRETVRDSEGDYWLHDRFLESPLGAQATDLYFKSMGARSRGVARSFGGHERNRFYWNRAGTNFLEVGYLLGVSLTADSRNVVADDLNADGQIDLIMTTMETWPQEKQTLKIFRNELNSPAANKVVPISAAQIGRTLEKENKPQSANDRPVHVYATGQGFRSQGPARLHD